MRMRGGHITLTGRLLRFARCEHGTIIVTWAAMLGVFMGLLALTFDFGRLATTQSELQSYADNVALASAGELDGNDDAISRATDAAANMISDSQTFGTGSTLLSGAADYTLSFHETDPSNDPIGTLTTDPQDAHFVRVVSAPQTVDLGFAAAFQALTGNTTMSDSVGAEAVAGFAQSACDITPLMFCMPSADFKADEHIGEVALLRTGGNGAGWGPGAFGWLDPDAGITDPDGPCAGLGGANLDVCLIAAAGQRTSCFATNGLTVQGGQRVGNFEAAFNVRFDIYQALMSNKKNDEHFKPAPHVISGYVPNGSSSCLPGNPDPSPDSVGFSPDDCFGSGGCTRFGDGDWSMGRANYIAINYGGADPHPTATTRYEFYLAEIAAAGGASSSTPILTGLSETGRPQCSPHQSGSPGRRVLVAAGIDCVANPISAGATVTADEFFEIFMISPIGLDGTKDFWVEIVGTAGAGAGGDGSNAIVRDVVKLYR